MVQIIAGAKGKGKTKYLLDMANTAVKEAKGSVVYLDKSSKHMYELNNQIRLINVQEYPIDTSDGFIGFRAGKRFGNIRKQGRMSPGFWEPEALLGMAASQLRRNLEAVQH